MRKPRVVLLSLALTFGFAAGASGEGFDLSFGQFNGSGSADLGDVLIKAPGASLYVGGMAQLGTSPFSLHGSYNYIMSNRLTITYKGGKAQGMADGSAAVASALVGYRMGAVAVGAGLGTSRFAWFVPSAGEVSYSHTGFALGAFANIQVTDALRLGGQFYQVQPISGEYTEREKAGQSTTWYIMGDTVGLEVSASYAFTSRYGLELGYRSARFNAHEEDLKFSVGGVFFGLRYSM